MATDFLSQDRETNQIDFNPKITIFSLMGTAVCANSLRFGWACGHPYAG